VARPRGPRTVRWLLLASALVAATAAAAPSPPGGPRFGAAEAPQKRRPAETSVGATGSPLPRGEDQGDGVHDAAPGAATAYLAELTARADGLGLADDPRVIAAASAAPSRMSPRITTGATPRKCLASDFTAR